ncbi:hypothetical protein DICVIV_01806 [Dictyocaulus viviparus]|uniref:Uncharacterized protein n=1 Tax=Dictyocaulus viviparus TaxID=29172 RepID=A0A0D8Y5I4_DICVI|nr:hypothetical protein DICVIV_01806 [Dictyocaulus viviparus]
MFVEGSYVFDPPSVFISSAESIHLIFHQFRDIYRIVAVDIIPQNLHIQTVPFHLFPCHGSVRVFLLNS